MDDTNPTKEDTEYVDSILADVRWLIAGWAERFAVAIATLWMAVLIVLVAGVNPAMLTDPYGALIKDLCLIACAITVWMLAPPLERPDSG